MDWEERLLLMSILPVLWLATTEYGYLANSVLENGGVISSIPEGINTFEGAENGVFKSTVLAGTDVQLTYILNFKETLNIKINDNPDESVDNNEDIISIKVFPETQNITLLDPNDNLLIDTNFDENFVLFLILAQLYSSCSAIRS